MIGAHAPRARTSRLITAATGAATGPAVIHLAAAAGKGARDPKGTAVYSRTAENDWSSRSRSEKNI